MAGNGIGIGNEGLTWTLKLTAERTKAVWFVRWMPPVPKHRSPPPKAELAGGHGIILCLPKEKPQAHESGIRVFIRSQSFDVKGSEKKAGLEAPPAAVVSGSSRDSGVGSAEN